MFLIRTCFFERFILDFLGILVVFHDSFFLKPLSFSKKQKFDLRLRFVHHFLSCSNFFFSWLWFCEIFISLNFISSVINTVFLIFFFWSHLLLLESEFFFVSSDFVFYFWTCYLFCSDKKYSFNFTENVWNHTLSFSFTQTCFFTDFVLDLLRLESFHPKAKIISELICFCFFYFRLVCFFPNLHLHSMII